MSLTYNGSHISNEDMPSLGFAGSSASSRWIYRCEPVPGVHFSVYRQISGIFVTREYNGGGLVTENWDDNIVLVVCRIHERVAAYERSQKIIDTHYHRGNNGHDTSPSDQPGSAGARQPEHA